MAVPCYLVRHSRIPPWISKILFVLGSYEFLAMLEGKIRKGSFNLEKKQCTVCLIPRPLLWTVVFKENYENFKN